VGPQAHPLWSFRQSGEVDLDRLVRWEGVFEPLRDPARFAQVQVDFELGTVVWLGGADIGPDVLYSAVTGIPIAVATETSVADERVDRSGRCHS